jgi:Tol biopolymer transport system component
MVVYSAVSRDFSLVVMTLTKPDKSSTYAVVRTDGTGYHEIAKDVNWSGTSMCGADISWDNSSALICLRQPGEPAELERISLADGKILNLLPNAGYDARLSPDGRFVASRKTEGVVVMPVQGGEPQLVADRDSHFIDWTRDGRNLIVEVLDGTTDALYLVPIRDGRQAGERILLRYGKFGRGRTAASGALIYETASQSGSLETWLGKLDSVGGSATWEKLSLTGNRNTIAEHYPTWSPDSNQIAYLSYIGPGASTVALRLRNMASGVERQLYKGDALRPCFWSAQRPNILCLQRDEKGGSQVLSISTDTGRTESLGAVPEGLLRDASPMLLSRDDVAIYFSSSKLGLVRWEPGAPTWTTVAEGPDFTTPSPDERWVIRSENGRIEIRPMAGGDWRALAPDTREARDVLTADGNWLVYTGLEATGKTGLFRVATSGGEPRRLGELPTTNFLSHMWMSPDGQAVIAEFQTSHEIWMLENFEPKQQASK